MIALGEVGTTLKLFDNISQPLNNVFRSLDKVLMTMEDLDTTAGKMDLTSSIREARTDIGVFTTQLDEMGQSLQETQHHSDNLFNSFKRYIGIGAIIEGSRRALGSMIGYDDAARQVMGITGNNSQEMLNALNSYTTAYTTGGLTKKDIAEGYQFTSLAGWDMDESTFAMPIMRDLKRVTGAEFGQISDLVTDSMTPLQLSIAQLPQFADQMARTQSISNTNIEQLLNAYQGGAFKGVQTGKMDMSELNAFIGVLGNAGIKGAEAGTQVRNIMNGLYGTEKKTQKILEQMDIQAYQGGEARNAFDLMQEFGAKLGQYDDQSKKQIMSGMFNVYDEVGLNALMTQLDKLPEYKTQIEQSDGALALMIETIDGGMGGAVRNALSQFSIWMAGLGTALEPVGMLFLFIAQSDFGSTLFMSIQAVAGGIGIISGLFMILFSVLDPLSPVIWGLIAALGVLYAAEKMEVTQKKVKALLTESLVAKQLAEIGVKNLSLKTVLMSIPLLIKEALARIASISPILAVVVAISAVIVVLIALAQKFDWLRVGMVKAINGIIGAVNWLLEQMSKIPVIGEKIGNYQIQTLNLDTALKFKNPLDDILNNEPKFPEIPGGFDIGTVGRVKDVEKNNEVRISDEDIKLLRDVAMKEAVVQYNTFKLEQKNSFGDVRETADTDEVITHIGKMLEEKIAVSTELVYTV